jgi:hypothetical protein
MILKYPAVDALVRPATIAASALATKLSLCDLSIDPMHEVQVPM